MFRVMFKILFLLLIFTSSVVFAQTQEEKKEPLKFFEYTKISDKLLVEKTQAFCAEINKTGWVGWIINTGYTEEINKREKQIRKSQKNYDCGKEFPEPRISFVRVVKKGVAKTVFWIVPPGENPPTP